MFDGSNHTFGLRIVLGGMRIRSAEFNYVLTNNVEVMVVKFVDMVVSKGFDITLELILNIFTKVKKFGKNTRLVV